MYVAILELGLLNNLIYLYISPGERHQDYMNYEPFVDVMGDE